MQQPKQVTKIIISVFLLGTFIFLSLNRHSKSQPGNYNSEIWADKAGYYIYLPAAFIHHFDIKSFPDSIEENIGNGFQFDKITNAIRTKYTYGVSLFEMPGFLVALALHISDSEPASGFETGFCKSIDITGTVFLWLGLLVFIENIRKKLSYYFSLLLGLLLILATNIFYYGIVETGMSHVYSFFCFNAFVYLWNKYIESPQSKKTIMLIGITAGLIVVLRPINLLFLFLPLGFRLLKKEISLLQIRKLIFNPRCLIPAAIISIPQLVYWYYLAGSPLVYSYQGESFSNLFHPKILEFLFSTNNGLLSYSPVIILLLLANLIGDYTKMLKIFFFGSFFILVYLFSSWWSWHYGCGYGSRTFVEFIPFFSIPFIEYFSKTKLKKPMMSLLLVCAVLNLKMMYSYDTCWYGGDWDWAMYYQLFTGPTK